MNLISSIKFKLWLASKTIISFYAFFIGISLLFTILAVSTSEGTTVSNGMNMASLIMIFVLAVSGFSESFHFGLANSISRKNVFISFILMLVPLSVVMSIIDTLIIFILSRFSYNLPLYALFYTGRYGVELGNGKAIIASSDALMANSQFILENMLWSIFAIILVGMLGYLISVIFYRLGKTGRAVFAFSLPMGLFMVLPAVDFTLFDGEITQGIFSFASKALGISSSVPNPYIAILTFSIFSIILGVISYLVMRRATIKQ